MEERQVRLDNDAAAHRDARAAESMEERQAILEEQRRRDARRLAMRTESQRQERAEDERARRVASRDAGLLPHEDAARMQATYTLSLPSQEEMDQIVDDAVKRFRADSDGRRTYIVTDPILISMDNATRTAFNIISMDNATRTAFNTEACRRAANNLALPHCMVLLPATFNSAKYTLTDADRIDMQQLPSASTGKLEPVLPMFVGMRVRVTENLAVKKRVANGSLGTIHHIDWPADTGFHQNHDGWSWSATKPPNTIWVNVDAAKASPRYPNMPEHWPDTVVPVLVQRRYFKFDVVKRSAAHAGQPVSNAVINASIAQYPVVPAYAMTCHGVQGKTLSSILLAEPRPAGMKVSAQAYYVGLSRVRTSAGLALTRAPTSADCEAFVPHADVRNEDERLKSMSADTIRRLKAQGL